MLDSIPNAILIEKKHKIETKRARGSEFSVKKGLWHSPSSLNFISYLLQIMIAVVLIYCAWQWFVYANVFPIRKIEVRNLLRHVTQGQLEYVVDQNLRQSNFITCDLWQTKHAFETIPWVDNVDIERKWPDTLELTIKERHAIAQWVTEQDHEAYLLDANAHVFNAETKQKLPILSGPKDSAEYVLEWYYKFLKQLEPMNYNLEQLTLTARGAWILKLQTGLTIILGKDQVKNSAPNRLARFLSVWPQANAKLGIQVKQVDLRYPNGFAATPVFSKAD